MLPRAYVSHEIDHRMRLRVPSKRSDQSYFEDVRDQLKQCTGVDAVKVNPLTASVLIQHHQSVEGLSEYSKQHKLFTIQRRMTKLRGSWSREIAKRIDHLDTSLQEISRGQWDLDTVAGMITFGLGAKQLLAGNALPPAWSLFSQAIKIVYGLRD